MAKALYNLKGTQGTKKKKEIKYEFNILRQASICKQRTH